MIEKLASFGAAVGISLGAAAFQTIIVPEEHSVAPAAPIADNDSEPEPSRQRQLRILTDGLRFEDLAVDPDTFVASSNGLKNSDEASQASELVPAEQFSKPIDQLIDGLTLLEEFQDIDLREKVAALPRVGGLASGARSSANVRSLTSRETSERNQQRAGRSLLRSESDSSARRSASPVGGVGGFGGARSNQSPGASTFPVAAASSNASSVVSSIDSLLQSPAVTARNTLLASNASSASFSSNVADVATVTSGRPQLTADGKYGIPNHQYWTFDFTDQNADNVVNRLDADLHFADYLTGLEADLEAAKQVVKFSPNELQSIYSDLNSQVPPEKSPSYLTFMIIDFPVKGFYLPYDEIPDNPGLPPGAVD